MWCQGAIKGGEGRARQSQSTFGAPPSHPVSCPSPSPHPSHFLPLDLLVKVGDKAQHLGHLFVHFIALHVLVVHWGCVGELRGQKETSKNRRCEQLRFVSFQKALPFSSVKCNCRSSALASPTLAGTRHGGRRRCWAVGCHGSVVQPPAGPRARRGAHGPPADRQAQTRPDS